MGLKVVINDDREQTGTQRTCIHRVFVICALRAFSGSCYVSSLLSVKKRNLVQRMGKKILSACSN